jgi:AcrR family transcriptional regulator
MFTFEVNNDSLSGSRQAMEGEVPSAAAFPVHQDRGRRTLERLLDAAAGALADEGLQGATVPAIAARAGVAVGTVYKRFPDKDALMRAVFERFFARATEQNSAALAPGMWAHLPLADVLSTLLSGMVEGYRRNRGLLRALLLYLSGHPDPDFKAHAGGLRDRTFGLLTELVLQHREEFSHPDPERAVRVVASLIGLSLQHLVLSEDGRLGALSLEDSRLASDLADVMLGYLGVAGV